MKKRIKWINVLKLIMFVCCASVILHDAYVLVSSMSGFTYWGVITHVVAWCVAGSIYLEIAEQ